MLVFWKEKLVIFALPKTGTTALEANLAPQADIAILNPPGLKHCNVPKYEREFQKIFEKPKRPLTRVAVIREPVDWLGSWYRYRSRPQIAGSPKAVPDISFDAFVEEWLKPEPADFARIGQQATFLSDRSGRLGIDHLYQFEELELAITFLEERLKRDIVLERRNVSRKPKQMLSPELVARLQEERPREFSLWSLAKGGAGR